MAEGTERGDRGRHRSSRRVPVRAWPLRGGSSLRTAAESIALLAAPVVVFFGWHVRAMPRTLMIDPFFYGAYALDGPDLLQRFGTGNYFWPRVGFILPDRLFVTLFGPLGGFFTFRYVLALVATIPVYILFRQVLGRWAAWLAVLVILTAPVILSAWGTDYPDSSAVSYLMAGAACLFIRSRTPRTQWIWTVAAGVLLGLAVNSQVVAGFTVVGVLTGRVVSGWADGRSRIIAELRSVLIGAVAVTAILVVCTGLTMGQWDIFRPTADAILQYRQPAQIALFHSSTWRWLIDDIYVFVPPALVAAWLITAWPVVDRTDISRAELGFATAACVTFVLHLLAQFVAKNWTLEYYLYTSMLWATVCPLLVFSVLSAARSGDPACRRRGGLVLATAALVGLPLLARLFRDQLQLDFRVALALVAVPSLGALIGRYGGRRAAARVAAVACVAGAATLLVVGLPEKATIFPGQVSYYTPDYGTALFGDGSAAVDEYAVFASLHQVVPTSTQVPGGLAMWWPANASRLVTVPSAQYLWILEALPAEMPDLNEATKTALYIRNPRLLLLLSDTGTEFDVAETALKQGGFAPTTLREATLRSGPDVLHVRVLELTTRPAARAQQLSTAPM
jgi:4-amino-4-deoxy-L-arabinose transferase-like glycosyltransferase